jgi:hypothetical protein
LINGKEDPRKSKRLLKKTGSILKILKRNNNLKQRIMGFYKLEIDGSFRGHFKTPAEAMAAADKWARPFKKRWVIKDPFNKVYAQG